MLSLPQSRQGLYIASVPTTMTLVNRPVIGEVARLIALAFDHQPVPLLPGEAVEVGIPGCWYLAFGWHPARRVGDLVAELADPCAFLGVVGQPCAAMGTLFVEGDHSANVDPDTEQVQDRQDDENGDEDAEPTGNVHR